MTGTHRTLFLILVMLLSHECTIRKRVHMGGYYIQWHKRDRAADRHAKQQEPIDTLIVEHPIDTLTPEPEQETDLPAVETTDSLKESRKKARKDRRFEPLGVTAAELLIPAALVTALDDQSETKTADFWLTIVFLVILSFCLVLGIISMIRYLRHPERYRFNIWAILALFFPIALIWLLLAGTVSLF